MENETKHWLRAENRKRKTADGKSEKSLVWDRQKSTKNVFLEALAWAMVKKTESERRKTENEEQNLVQYGKKEIGN